MRKIFSLFLASAVLTAFAGRVRVEINGQDIQMNCREVSCSKNLQRSVVGWLPENKQAAHLIFETAKNAPDKWEEYYFTFTPGKTGTVRLMLRSGWTKKHMVSWVQYDDLKVSGTKIFNPSFETVFNGVISEWMLRDTNMCIAGENALNGKNYIRAAHDFVIRQDIDVTAGVPVTVKFFARNGGNEKRPEQTTMRYSRPVAAEFVKIKHPASYYRLYNDRMKYLPLKDKGILPEMIEHQPAPVPGEIPESCFSVPESGSLPAVDLVKIPLELLEENGVARTAAVRYGIPIAQGHLFELGHIRVVDPAGKNVPAQFAATGFWADKSIKWLLVQFSAPLRANEKVSYAVEYGKKIGKNSAAAGSMLKETADKLFIDTGVLQAEINKKQFAMLENIRINGKYTGTFAPGGLTLVTEQGKTLSSTMSVPEKITVLQNGSRNLSIKIRGKYSDDSPGSYTVVLGFTSGSGVVDMAVNHTNTCLKSEFTDITSLGMRLNTAGKVSGLTMDDISVPTGKQLFQKEEFCLSIDGKDQQKSLSGAGSAAIGQGRITFALENAAYRYPKAFSTTAGSVGFELLPEMPDAKFGTHLPDYLQFPFCEGKYRLKWGMGFTEHLKIDFSGKASAVQLGAMDIVPVIGRDYLRSTKVIPGIAPQSDRRFDRWDENAVMAFYRHMEIKKRIREYGFLNYGDWFGERGRNWTNNEYDLAHGLYMLYARTGNRDVFRWAVTAARHQADVDIIHAYPDPYFIGANAQHGIGHTGVNHQRHIQPASWSYPVDYSFRGAAGHTWSQGMLETWCFTGDVQVMDAALKLGEHLVRYTAPRLKKLSTHERSAGWSGKALLAYYHVTGDKKYLDATKLLINVALREQKFDKGGAWPHKMPKDHSGGFKNAYGNTPFLIGTLLAMMRDYHMITGDPAVARSIISGAGWQQRSWDDKAMAFPYALSWDNKPYFPPGFSGTSSIATPGVSYRAILTGDKYGFHIAKSILSMNTVVGINPIGKSLSMELCYTGDIMEDILRFQEKYPDAEPYVFNASAMLKKLNKREQSFNLRGPDRKEFRIFLNAERADLTLERHRTGARPESKPAWKMQIIAPDGKTVTDVSGDVKEQHYSGKFTVTGKKGDFYTVIINDDMTGHWNVVPGKDHTAFTRVVADAHFAKASPACLYFTVPAGTREFSFDISGVHLGTFRAWIIKDESTEVAQISGLNDGKPLLPWLKRSSDPTRRITVKLPEPLPETAVWKLLVLAVGDIRINMQGIPQWLSVVPAAYPGSGK